MTVKLGCRQFITNRQTDRLTKRALSILIYFNFFYLFQNLDLVPKQSGGLDSKKGNLKNDKQIESIVFANETASELLGLTGSDVHPTKQRPNYSKDLEPCHAPDFVTSLLRENSILNISNDEKRGSIEFTRSPASLKHDHAVGALTNVDDGFNSCSISLVKKNMSKNCVRTKREDNENLFDMDALSEFPIDYNLSECTGILAAYTQRKNSNLDQPTFTCTYKQNNKFSNNNSILPTIYEQVDEADTRCHDGSHNNVPVANKKRELNISKISSETIPNKNSEQSKIITKDDWPSHKNIDTKRSPSTLGPSPGKSKLKESNHENACENRCQSTGREEESPKVKMSKYTGNVETASQVLQDLVLQHRCDSILNHSEDFRPLQISQASLWKPSITSFNDYSNGDCHGGHITKTANGDAKCNYISISFEQKQALSSIEISNEEEENFKDAEDEEIVFQQSDASVVSGQSVAVSMESVKKGGKILAQVGKNDESKYDDKKVEGNANVGLSTSSRKKEIFNEESSKKSKDSLGALGKVNENNCKKKKEIDEKSYFGFSTVSQKKGKVSEESLNETRRTVNGINKNAENVFQEGTRVDENAYAGFSTALEKEFAVSEESLTKDGTILDEVNKDKVSNCQNGKTEEENVKEGFLAVCGRKITVSKEPFEKRILNKADESDKNICKNSFRVDENSKVRFSRTSGNEVDESACIEFLTAFRKKVTISDESWKKDGKIVNETNKDEEYNCRRGRKFNEKVFVGFSTASGKKLKVSEESLRKARVIVSEVDKDDENKRQGNRRVIKEDSIGLSRAFGKKVEISEQPLRKEKILSEVNKDEENECQHPTTMDEQEKVELSPVSEKEVKVSERTMKEARILNAVDGDENECQGRRSDKEASVGFSTVSGKKVDVSDVSLKIARRILNELKKGEDDRYQDPRRVDEKASSEFLTTYGKESSKKVTNSNQLDKDEQIKCQNSTKGSGKAGEGVFTAPRKKVAVSVESLKKESRILSELNKGKEYKCQDGITMNRKANFGFSTASGKKVTVSDGSIKKARRILNDVDHDEPAKHWDSRRVDEKANVEFSVTSGKVAVSDVSLTKASKIFNQQDKGEEIRHKYGRNVDEKSRVGFYTASGKRVEVSEESLKKARSTLNQVDVEDKTKYQDGREVEEETGLQYSFPFGRKTSDVLLQREKVIPKKPDCYNIPIFEEGQRMGKKSNLGFLTASGKNVVVSEESLTKAREIIKEVCNDEGTRFDGEVNLKQQANCSFLTATRTNVYVTGKSLKKARTNLSNVDRTEEVSCSKCTVSNQIGRFGFSAASGENETISEESLKRVIGNMEEGEEDDRCKLQKIAKLDRETKLGIATVSGKKIQVSQESLEKAGETYPDDETNEGLRDLLKNCSTNVKVLNNQEVKRNGNSDRKNSILTIGLSRYPINTDPAIIQNYFKCCSELHLDASDLRTMNANNENLGAGEMSERTLNEISESSRMLLLDESFIDVYQPSENEYKVSDHICKETACNACNRAAGPERNFKRLSSEIEAKDGKISLIKAAYYLRISCRKSSVIASFET